MPYIVNFTDKENKTPITVFDNTSSTDTSLTFPGRNVTGYGQIIAENFLSLLENFASADEPVNPIEGQLWYDSTDGILQIWDNTAWKAASGIQKGVSEPSVAVSKVGELWVDTTNQQLRIFTGSRWILVGPTESSVGGLRYGPVIEKIADSDNVDRYVLIFYIADIPVIIFSKDSFTPKILISGFDVIRSGINIANPSTPIEVAQFSGGFEPTLFGPASTANGLTVGGLIIQSSKFLRSDTINTTDFAFNIRNNNGVTVGVDQTFNIGTTATAAKIYNSAAGSSIDIQLNRDGIPSTILKVVDNKVGINQAVPSQALDIDGSLTLTGSVIVTNISASTNLNNGSFRTAGGAAVTKNLLVGDGVDITGVSQTNLIQPKNTDLYDLGTTAKRWRTIRAKTVIADTIEGVLSGNISGNANTATALTNVTSFQMTGDVASPAVQFDGQLGSYVKVFNTSLTANIIANKIEAFTSKPNDYVLTYRSSDASLASSGLLKQTRDAFVGDMGIPIGGIIPYAGAIAPYGFLFCDGSEVERTKFQALFDVIGPIYNGASPLLGVLTFRLPDLRGRFALGKDNMDNAGTVPLAIGGGIDGGGGTAGRVPDVKAITLGGDAGSSSATLIPANLPQHRHTLSSGNQDYKAVFVSTTIDPLATTGLGPTAPGQAQYLERTGDMLGVPTTSTPIGIMNPFLTINYIIRSGPPLF